MDETHYHWIVAIAKKIYLMIVHSANPCHFAQKDLQGERSASWQAFLRVQGGKSYSGLENDSRRMNFGAMELNAMIHDLEQQEMANQTRGPVRDGYKRPFRCIQIRK